MPGDDQQRQYGTGSPYGYYPVRQSTSQGGDAAAGPSAYPQYLQHHDVGASQRQVDPQSVTYHTQPGGRPTQEYMDGNVAVTGNTYYQHAQSERRDPQRAGVRKQSASSSSQNSYYNHQTHPPTQFELPPGPPPPIGTWPPQYQGNDTRMYARHASGSGVVASAAGMAPPFNTYASHPPVPSIPLGSTEQQWGYAMNYSIPPGPPPPTGIQATELGDDSQQHRPPRHSSRQDHSSSGSPGSGTVPYDASGQPLSPRGDELDEVLLPIGSRDRRRAQNKIAQRAFRERAKVQAQEEKDHLAELEALTAHQAEEIRQMNIFIQNLRRENAALRAGNPEVRPSSTSMAVQWTHAARGAGAGAGAEHSEMDGDEPKDWRPDGEL